MNLDSLVGFGAWAAHELLERDEAARWTRAFCIIFPILIIKFNPDLDWPIRLFLVAVLSWNVVVALAHAIDDGPKNECKIKGCTCTASILPEDPIEEPEPKPSSSGPDSRSSSSMEPTDGESLPETSTSPPENTDAP